MRLAAAYPYGRNAIVMAEFTPFSSAEMAQMIEQLTTLYDLEVNNREAERKQVAAYLNDTVVQTLSALHIHFSLLHTASEAQMRHELVNTLPLMVDLITGLTDLARQLRPLELDTVGLHEALQLAAEEFTLPAHHTISYAGSPEPPLPARVTTAFYRLAREVLQGVQKNTQATEVFLQLQARHQGICLTIQSNALLFDVEQPVDSAAAPGLDLLGLMVRFKQLNGRLMLHDQPGGSKVVTAVWPWFDAPPQDAPGSNPFQCEPG